MTTRSPEKSTDTKFVAYDHLDKVGEIAVYYGFTPMKSPAVGKADLDAARDLLDGDFVDDETSNHGQMPLHAEEKIAIIRTYQAENMHMLPQPVMLYMKDPCRGSPKKGGYHRYADLEIVGSSGPIAEATLIQTARAMLAEEGYAATSVEINSLGDRDSITRFTRELIAYYRKHVNDMSPECRQLMKRDPFELLASRNADAIELNRQAPRALDFLSETSRRHLEEVLEYLEALGIPYVLNNALIGNRKYCTETIFTIVRNEAASASTAVASAVLPAVAAAGESVAKTDAPVRLEPIMKTEPATKGQHILGVGVRYNGLARRLGVKRDVEGIGVSLIIKDGKNGLRKPVAKVKRPIASFIQLGLESKLLSLDVIERLRRVKIPLYLSLAKDRLGAQVSSVEKYHTPYVIVMGKKEAVERTAIVRRTDTHSQDIVAIEELPKYMKKIEDQWNKKVGLARL